ncbi:MAG: AAA family ATPase [Vulcanimicrobiaceae bacterium]
MSRAVPVASFVYRAADGKPLARIDRVEPGRDGRSKEFFPHLADGIGGFKSSPGLEGVKLPLYRLPDVLRAARVSGVVWMTEGEKKADALVEQLRESGHDAAATTLQGGAMAALTPQHLESLRGAKSAVVLMDSDKTGRESGLRRAQAIAAVVKDTVAIDLFPERTDGSDVLDFFAEGNTLDGLLEYVSVHADEIPVRPTPFEPSRNGHVTGPIGTAHGMNLDAKKAGPATTAPKPALKRTKLTKAADVRKKKTVWLEPLRFPLGALVALDGPGGVGKTTFMFGLMAKATRGRSLLDPAARREPLNVMIVAEEDSRSMHRMRLEAAGAELDRVTFFDGTECEYESEIDGELVTWVEPLMIPKDLPRLRDAIKETESKIVYIDALFSHLEFAKEGKSSHDVRPTLSLVPKLAEETGCLFAGTRHWNKGTGSAVNRVQGPADLTHVARVTLSVGRDPEDPERVIVAVGKTNFKKPESLAFRLVPIGIEDDFGEMEEVTYAAIEPGTNSVTADDLAMRAPGDPEEKRAGKDWLSDYMADGEWRLVSEITKAWQEKKLGALATLYRAKDALGIEVGKTQTFPTLGRWRLPGTQTSQSSEQTSHIPTSEKSGLKTPEKPNKDQTSHRLLISDNREHREVRSLGEASEPIAPDDFEEFGP